MAETGNSCNKNSNDVFNALTFERKLVELVEELRLRRNLEAENEKTLKSIMDEKYNEELYWDEQQSRHVREKEDLEQEIELLKRKLEDKVCVIDDDKAKQQLINRTYSHEMRMLKEELRTSKSEKLNLQKKIQELEGKLQLQNKFQESLVAQIAELRKMTKSITEEGQRLSSAQKNVMENVSSAKESVRKFELCNRHLRKCIDAVGRRSEVLKKELILARSELTLLKQPSPTEKKKPSDQAYTEKLQNKILDLENWLLVSQSENEKTLSHVAESNELLCKFMDKYSEIREREKQLARDVELAREKLEEEMRKTEETEALRQKEKMDNQRVVEVQTEVAWHCSSCAEHRNFEETSPTQQNSAVGQQRLQRDPECSRDRRITVSEVLKRKIEIMEFGDEPASSRRNRFPGEESEALGTAGGSREDVPPTEPSDEMMALHDLLMDRKHLGAVSSNEAEIPEEKRLDT